MGGLTVSGSGVITGGTLTMNPPADSRQTVVVVTDPASGSLTLAGGTIVDPNDPTPGEPATGSET